MIKKLVVQCRSVSHSVHRDGTHHFSAQMDFIKESDGGSWHAFCLPCEEGQFVPGRQYDVLVSDVPREDQIAEMSFEDEWKRAA